MPGPLGGSNETRPHGLALGILQCTVSLGDVSTHVWVTSSMCLPCQEGYNNSGFLSPRNFMVYCSQQTQGSMEYESFQQEGHKEAFTKAWTQNSAVL